MVTGIFEVEASFIITGRGLVFAGTVLSGEINRGDTIYIKVGDRTLKRKISGVEGIRRQRPDRGNVGILVDCESEEDMKGLRALDLSGIQCEIQKSE